MEVWFDRRQEPRLRGQRTRRGIRKELYPRSSKARRKSFCPLDNGLSWKSGYRTCPVAAFTSRSFLWLENQFFECYQ
jgi:hypothetical protein